MGENLIPLDLVKSKTSPDLSKFAFCVANAETDFEEILVCRWRGYKKYGFVSPAACRDQFDERAVHYISREAASGKLVGCLRMLSRFDGVLELERFVDISKWIEAGACPAELSRFSVPLNKNAVGIKFGLWKLAWSDAVQKGHSHFIIWTRKEVQRNYDMLGFQYFLGEEKTFCHPLLGGYPHVLMTLDIFNAAQEYRMNRPALHKFFCETDHPNIRGWQDCGEGI